MTGLDCNILVQLALQDHPANSATVAAVKAEVQSGNTLLVPALVINEFLHVVTDERRFSPPLTMTEALGWIEDFIANSAVKVPDTTAASLHQTLQWMRKYNLGRKRILDTYLAAILYAAGVRRLLTSNTVILQCLRFLKLSVHKFG
jgi:predicted nucleic acid-binding protein